MQISAPLVPDAVFPNLRVTSKTQAFQVLSRLAAEITGLPPHAILDALLLRERLGTTGIGEGVAIPHGRLPNITGLVGVFARLDAAIDFDSDDGRPVDLIFLLLAPDSAGADHLAALAQVSRLLRNKPTRDQLRRSHSGGDVVAALGRG